MPRRYRVYAECKHCKVKRNIAARGLCNPCYWTPGVREQYKKLDLGPKEPTEEELNATIAQQMRNLPKWWNESEAQEYSLTGMYE